MAAQNTAALNPSLLSAWNREYRISLAVILVGVVVLVADSVLAFPAILTGNYSALGGTGLAIYLLGTAGFMLIVLGGSWAYTNRRLLQLSGRDR